MAFVLDASVALPWCFVDETTPFTLKLLHRAMAGEELLVPAHWPTEVLNALIQGKRRGRVTDDQIERFLDDLASFRITVEEEHALSHMSDLRLLAEKHRLTAYDAAYLGLAKRMGLPLATLDGEIIQAARVEGVPLVE